MRPCHLRLIDGPLVDLHRPMLQRMTADLLRFEATGTRSDAIRALTGRYASANIALLVDDALFEARQGGVATAISAP